MQKVYLLLRNNKQSGPHSLEDLVQLNLKPMDLIWEEGKSFSWSYPTEITILKAYVSDPKEVSSAKAENHDPGPLPTTHDAYMPPGVKKTDEPKLHFPSMCM